MGTFPRVTLPSAGAVLLRPLDLHVLGLPPAFALSQDQTLKFLDENLISAGHFTFDEVPPLIACTTCVALATIGVDLKRVPPKSRPPHLTRRLASSIKDAARKDSAVHVSLSSYSLVKQPGTVEVPLSGTPESRRSFNPRPRSAAFHYHLVIELQRREVTPCKAVRRADGPYIVGPLIRSQHLQPTKFIILQCGSNLAGTARKLPGAADGTPVPIVS
jgi:hypothetical protein